MTLTIATLDRKVPATIRLKIFEALARYCNIYNVSVRALDNLIATKNLSESNITAIIAGINDSENIPEHRKTDISNLLAIMQNITEGTSLLFYQISQYLSRMHTGWWIFKGGSKLKDYISEALAEFNAAEQDSLLMNSLSQLLHSSETPISDADLKYRQEIENSIRFLKNCIERYDVQIKDLEKQIDEKNKEIEALLRENHRILNNQLTKQEGLSLRDRLEKRLSTTERPQISSSSNMSIGNVPMQNMSGSYMGTSIN